MDVMLIPSALAGLKNAFDLTRALVDLKVSAEATAKVIELQQAILSAQSTVAAALGEQEALKQEIRALKEELARAKDWEKQKARYNLTGILGGIGLVYALKKSASNGEPPHWICTRCYEDGRRSILNQGLDLKQFITFNCPVCKSSIHTGYRGVGPAEYAPE